MSSPTFDYLYREVSAQTGEGMNEAFDDFIGKIYDFQLEKKKRVKVFVFKFEMFIMSV
jgi:hypothetical protein